METLHKEFFLTVFSLSPLSPKYEHKLLMFHTNSLL